MKEDMNELKEWALAIVDIYSDLNRMTEREAYILRKAITMDRPQGEWVRKEDLIHYIATQYIEHNELVPIWLSIGDMKGGKE